MRIEKVKTEINPKIIRKITKYLVEGKFPDEQIYEDGAEFKEVELQFKKFLSQDLSFYSLSEIIGHLEVKIQEKNIERIIKDILEIPKVEILFSFFIKKYLNNDYDKYTFLLLKLCTNWWLNTNDYSMIIFYPSYMRGLNQLIEESADEKLIEKMLRNFYRDTYYKNETHIVTTENAVKQKIIELKPVLRNQFDVKHITLFGSYAKNKQTKFSDIDLIVELYQTASENKLKPLDDYLSAIFEIRVNSVLDGSFIKDKITSEVF